MITTCAVLIFFCNIYLFNDYVIDDSFITFRFAENLAEGDGLTFTPGEKPVEGYSNFLWLLLLAALFKIGFPTVLIAKYLGLLLTLTTGILWFYKYYKQTSPFWILAPLYLVCPLVTFWGTSGLELGLHALLVTLLFFSIQKKSKLSFVYLILLILNRPEGVAIAFLFLLFFFLKDIIEKKKQYSFWITGLIVIAVTTLALTLFRLQHFGYIFPNTYYAKTHYQEHGYNQLLEMLLYLLPLTLSYIIGIIFFLKKRTSELILAFCMILILAQAVISSNVSPVMNFMFRYMIPFLPFFIYPVIKLLDQTKKPALQGLIIGAVLISFSTFYPGLTNLIVENNKIIAAQDDFIEWAESLPKETTISMTDLGRIPYYTGLKFNDLWGLLDEQIGQNGFDAKKEFLHQPDYFLLVGHLDSTGLQLRFSRERLIAYNNLFHSCYQLTKAGIPPGADMTNPGYYYLAFQKKPNTKHIFNSLR